MPSFPVRKPKPKLNQQQQRKYPPRDIEQIERDSLRTSARRSVNRDNCEDGRSRSNVGHQREYSIERHLHVMRIWMVAIRWEGKNKCPTQHPRDNSNCCRKAQYQNRLHRSNETEPRLSHEADCIAAGLALLASQSTQMAMLKSVKTETGWR